MRTAAGTAVGFVRSGYMDAQEHTPKRDVAPGAPVHVEAQDARSGTTPHIVRYMLIISTLLAIAALSAIWITGALTTSDATPPEEAAAQSGATP